MKICDNCNCSAEKLFEADATRYKKRFRQDMAGFISVCERCLNEEKERQIYLNKIINSDECDRKLILAGPGTGKTYTFQQYIRKKIEPSDQIYIITFINNLVNDLGKDIKDDNVKINTFHRFSYHLLKLLGKDYLYCPNLTEIVIEDIKITENKNINKDVLIKNLNHYKSTADIKSYFLIGSYYKALGNDNIAFGLLKTLKELGTINLSAHYKQIIVDEYQDFNFTESEIIKIISKDNKIIVAGDDDQALYGFKHSHPKYIRSLYNDPNFKKFKLPFCSRCTEVITNSLIKFIENAKNKGLLSERINDKPYQCYFPDKYNDCKKYPQMIWHKTSHGGNFHSGIENILFDNIKKYIEENEIEEGKLNFLIIYPSERVRLCKSIESNIMDRLRKSGFNIVEAIKKIKADGLSINDAYAILKKDKKSNLGWRIVIKNDPLESKDEIIRNAIPDRLLYELLPQEYIDKHLKEVEEMQDDEMEELEIEEKDGINILFTNLYGSKGLSADHVFVLFAQDEIFPKIPDHPTEDEVYKFLVAMTRPKKSLHFVTIYPHRSTFINMLPRKNIK